jgi:hypothetical protein
MPPRRVSGLAKRLLLQYKIKCKEAKEGCRWTGSISEEEQHNGSQVRPFPPSSRPAAYPSAHSVPTASSLAAIAVSSIAKSTLFFISTSALTPSSLVLVVAQTAEATLVEDCSSGRTRRSTTGLARTTGLSTLFLSPLPAHGFPPLRSCTANLDCKTRSTAKNIAIHEVQCRNSSRRLEAALSEAQKVKAVSVKKDAELALLRREVKQLKRQAQGPPVKQEEEDELDDDDFEVPSLPFFSKSASSSQVTLPSPAKPSKRPAEIQLVDSSDDEVMIVETNKKHKTT